MFAEIAALVPKELLDNLHQRVKSSNACKDIAWKIKLGMGAAIGELRGQSKGRSIFDETQFPINETEDETVLDLERYALQTVYAFLESRGLTWTLGCLEKETHVERAKKDGTEAKNEEGYDLLELLMPDEALEENEEEEEEEAEEEYD
jgi:hypothetical protein